MQLTSKSMSALPGPLLTNVPIGLSTFMEGLAWRFERSTLCNVEVSLFFLPLLVTSIPDDDTVKRSGSDVSTWDGTDR